MNPIRIADVTNGTEFRRAIIARIDYKSNLITCKTGNLMLILHLMDASGIISAVAFGTDAEEYHKTIELNKVYEICNYGIHKANKTYIKLEHDYELIINKGTEIKPYANEAGDVPARASNFVTIAEILKMKKDTIVDCIAVCRIVDFLKTGTSNNNDKEYQSRKLYLVDHSNAVITLTLWSEDARDIVATAPFVIDIRKAIIKVYENEVSLSKNNGTSIDVNPASLAHNHNLNLCLDFEWFDPLFYRKASDGYYKLKGVIYCIDCENLYYKTNKQKKRKLSTDGDEHGLRLKMYVGTTFGKLKLIGFNKFVENFIGKSTEDVIEALERDPTSAEEIFKPIYYKTFIFYVQWKRKLFEGKMNSDNIIISAMPVNVKEYNEYLIANLKKIKPIE